MSELTREKKYCACCPCCGNLLQKSVIANTEMRCSKCGFELVILVENGIVTVFETKRDSQQTREKFKKRAAAYNREMTLMQVKDKVTVT
ncbi:MAG: hypothetical protein Q4G58_04935 [bacterium]|nr:hypothetical protein [bacterium]